MEDKIAENYNEHKAKLQRGIKDRAFDLIGIVIVIVLIALSLGVLERRTLSWGELGDILIECIPFFFAAMLLNENYYNKGVFAGKRTDKFKRACETYTEKVDALTGQQIDELDEFCQEYNDDALKKMQMSYLNRASISYEKFHVGDDGQEPIQTWSKDKLIHTYGKDRAKWITLAKNAKVKGLQVNALMGTVGSNDITDIGPSESQLNSKRRTVSAASYFVTTFVMAMIGVKNVTQWGWVGIALVLFKAVYILCRAYMTYFDGYNDVNVILVNHTNRKSDILKQFDYWYTSRHKIVKHDAK